MSTPESSLNPHQIWVIWDESGTELLDTFLTEKEALQSLESMMENDMDPNEYHIAAYDLNHATKYVPDPYEDEPMDYDTDD